MVIVNWNGASLLRSCLASLQGQTRAPDEVVVVDNGSTDESVALLHECFPWVRTVELSSNRGFAGGANAGIEASTGSWVALVNNDVTCEPAWLATMLTAAEHASGHTAFLQAKILDAEGTSVDSAGDCLDWAFTAHQRGHGDPSADERWDHPTPLLLACAAATFYRREFFDDVGGFDERFFAYYEDTDLCLRGARRGWRGEYVPGAVVRHAASSTSGRVPGFKIYQSTRNSWWLLYKNVPTGLVPRVLPRFVLTHVVWMVRAWRLGDFWAAVRGHRDGLLGLRRFRGDRGWQRAGAADYVDHLVGHLTSPIAVHSALRRLRRLMPVVRGRVRVE